MDARRSRRPGSGRRPLRGHPAGAACARTIAPAAVDSRVVAADDGRPAAGAAAEQHSGPRYLHDEAHCRCANPVTGGRRLLLEERLFLGLAWAVRAPTAAARSLSLER